MKFFYLVWRNLTRRKLRTTLTLLSILVAFVMFGVLSAMKVALTGIDTIADNNRLIVLCMVEPEITLEEVQALRKTFSHKAFQELINTAGAVNVGMGVDVPKSPISSLDLQAG